VVLCTELQSGNQEVVSLNQAQHQDTHQILPGELSRHLWTKSSKRLMAANMLAVINCDQSRCHMVSVTTVIQRRRDFYIMVNLCRSWILCQNNLTLTRVKANVMFSWQNPSTKRAKLRQILCEHDLKHLASTFPDGQSDHITMYVSPFLVTGNTKSNILDLSL